MQTVRIIGKEGKYDHTGVLIPVVKIDGEDCFLLTRRSGKISYGLEICFPGGKMDASLDATTLETALRETEEELGIERAGISQIEYLGTIIAPTGVLIDGYLCTIAGDVLGSSNFNRHEIDELLVLPVKDFDQSQCDNYSVQVQVNSFVVENNEVFSTLPSGKLATTSQYPDRWLGKSYPVPLYRTEYGPIWGLTAEFINETIELLASRGKADVAEEGKPSTFWKRLSSCIPAFFW